MGKQNRNQSKKSYAQINTERVEKLLEREPANVKAVIANTIETKKIAAKLPLIDMIFSNARKNVGYSVDMQDFTKIVEEFSAILDQIDGFIETAEELKIYKPYGKKEKKSKTSEKTTTSSESTKKIKSKTQSEKLETTIAELLTNGKTPEEIALAIGEDIETTNNMIKTILK